MTRPIIDQNPLTNEHKTATIWQRVSDGIAEPAISARTFENGDNKLMIELRQEDHCILLNGETLSDLFALLKRWVH